MKQTPKKIIIVLSLCLLMFCVLTACGTKEFKLSGLYTRNTTEKTKVSYEFADDSFTYTVKGLGDNTTQERKTGTYSFIGLSDEIKTEGAIGYTYKRTGQIEFTYDDGTSEVCSFLWYRSGSSRNVESITIDDFLLQYAPQSFKGMEK